MKIYWQLLVSGIWPIIKPHLQRLLSDGGKAAVKIGVEYAKQAASKDGWTDEEKFQFVNDSIRHDLERDGYQYTDSLINSVVEAVLPYLKVRGDA